MSDRLTHLLDSPPGRFVAKQVGLPTPVDLRRYEPGQPVLDGPVLVGAAPGGRLLSPAATLLRELNGEVLTFGGPHVRKQVSRKPAWTPGDDESDQSFHSLIFDA